MTTSPVTSYSSSLNFSHINTLATCQMVQVYWVLNSLIYLSHSLISFKSMFKHPIVVMHLHAQLFLTVCDPMDYSPPGSSAHGIFQARILESESHSVVSYSLWPHGLYSLWNSLGQNTGVGSLSLLQGIFPTQGLNPGLSHCRHILYQLNHKGYLSALQFLYPGDLPDSGIKPTSPVLQADSLPLEPLRLPKYPRIRVIFLITSYQMVFSVLIFFSIELIIT